MPKIITEKLSGIPIYKQIVIQIEEAIKGNQIKKNQKLPSINKVCMENSISRDSVLLAYDELKRKGIIFAIAGKGYYVKTNEFDYTKRYFLLFDELNAFKEDIYNSFMHALDGKAQIDIYFHHFNIKMFSKLINDANGNYSKYIIMPSNMQGIEEIISKLPLQDVYILDQTRKSLSNYPSIFQNFVNAMYQGLLHVKPSLDKFKQLILVFPAQKEPLGMVKGFERFCDDFQFNNKIIPKFEGNSIQIGDVYITPNDIDLVAVIEKANELKLDIGNDIGIISYNDTPLKKVVINGITTISTDFKEMGQQLANMVWNQQNVKIENPSRIIIRKSI